MELCIDFGGTDIKLALVAHGAVISSASVPVRDTRNALDIASTEARALVRASGRSPRAAGIAVPGVVDPDAHALLHANDKYASLRGVDLRAWARDELGLPAAVENDARAALIGETSSGDARGAQNAVLVALGTGIGTAALVDGRVLRGARGNAGILGGHATVDIGGPACPCGNVGCAEALASTWALRTHHPQVGDMPALIASSATNPEHAELLDSFLHVWSATVVTLCHMYDPEVVLLTGGVMRAGDIVRNPIESYTAKHLWPSITAPAIVATTQPELSVVRGLSVLAEDLTRHEEAS